MLKTIYTCTNCDSQFPKWAGRCTECSRWGTLEVAAFSKANTKKQKLKDVPVGRIVSFNNLDIKNKARLKTGFSEVDQILGDGIVSGSLILLGGDPGIGKSTLVLQIAEKLTKKVLYISGEESAVQVKLRLDRLELKGNKISFLNEECVEIINKTILKEKPELVVIDSIQTVYSEEVAGEAGNINQIKASCVKFLEVAKKENIPIIIVDHVTKEGVIAGPKTLEHLVDVVLYLEGDNYHDFRLLRTTKNRFGATNEVSLFALKEKGLEEIKNPSQIFLSNNSENPGSCVAAVLEGKRVFLVEVQALVSKTVFGFPVRKSSGFDNNRLQMLVAVLTKRAKLPLGNQDIYVNVVGGLKVKEPAIDLAVCLSLVSAFTDKSIDKKTVAFGEVGLSGEIRSVLKLKDRIKEAKKLGFTNIISVDQVKEIKEAIKSII